MPVTIYNDGSRYGDADAIYGRISAELSAAQDSHVRETALDVRIKDWQLNSWEHFAGDTEGPAESKLVTLYRAYEFSTTGRLDAWDLNYYAFRGATVIIKLGNGSLVRLRNGDPADASDRQIWRQDIADPTDPSDWTSAYSVLYSGTHYSVNGVSDGTASGFITWHTKSDGVYRNNVKIRDNSAFDDIYTNPKALAVSLVGGTNFPEAGWVVTIQENPFDHHRTILFYWNDDLNFIPSLEDFSYEEYRAGVSGIELDINTFAYIHQGPIYTSPRSELQGSVVAVGFKIDGTNSPLYPIRGIGSGSGISYMTGGKPMLLSDGYYYMFGGEVHIDALRRSPAFGTSTNLGRVLPVWIRSKDLKHWSEPVVGPTFKNGHGAAMVEVGGYLYWSTWETVWRRPVGSVTYDVTNYVTETEFDLPRDNQPGIGHMTIANPEGVNNYLLDFRDKELNIKVGLKTTNGLYEYVEYDQWFMKKTTREIEGKTHRLQLEFGNLWDRADNQMKDVTTFVGRFVWDDFRPDGKNQPFNYYFQSDTGPTVVGTNHRLRTKGVVLATAWKGHNPDIAGTFSNLNGLPRVVFRYKNAKNYWYIQYDRTAGPRVSLYQRKNGADTEISFNTVAVGGGSIPSDSTPRIRVRLQWYKIQVWINNTQVYDSFMGQPFEGEEGYAGFSSSSGKYDVGYVHIEDYEYDLTMADLIKTALAMADFHDVLVSDAGTRAYAITWGPRTDIATVADALRTSMEVEKLQLVWRNGSVIVGKFNDQTSVKTIQDTVIESDKIEEANRRLNFAQVDGNDRFWIEVDTEDVRQRARLLVSYLDLPELDNLDAISERAREELRRSAMGSSPGGTTPLYFDLSRMDTITWIDNAGNSHLVRIEGFSVEINQSTKPVQHQTFDLAEYIQSSDGSLVIPEQEE